MLSHLLPAALAVALSAAFSLTWSEPPLPKAIATLPVLATVKPSLTELSGQIFWLKDIPQWVGAMSLLGGAIAAGFGVYGYYRTQRWQRIQFLREAVRDFEHNSVIWKVLKIFDFEEYQDYETSYNGQPLHFRAENHYLYNALASHDQRVKRKAAIDALPPDSAEAEKERQSYAIETTLRDWFNQLLNKLEHFGYLIESGMLSKQEIYPWMIYWIRLLADQQYKRPNASKLYDALYSYIHAYKFAGVIQLFHHFGYRILPTPYEDTDFQQLVTADTLAKSDKEIDLSTAYYLNKAAYLVYQDSHYITEIIEDRWRINPADVTYFDDRLLQPIVPFTVGEAQRDDTNLTDTQGLIFKAQDRTGGEFIVLVFRGSQQLKDWQTNFSTKLKSFKLLEPLEEDITPPRGFVHSGFQRAWNSVEAQVIKRINQWNQPSKPSLPIFITGHSLGGAVATVAAASLVKRRYNIQGVYTFGQPKVGGLVFATETALALKGKFFRFVNNNDIVPYVPPPFSMKSIPHVYCHVGKLLYFNVSGQLILQPNLIERLTDLLRGLLTGLFEPGLDFIADHCLERYLSHLKKAAEREQQAILEQQGIFKQ